MHKAPSMQAFMGFACVPDEQHSHGIAHRMALYSCGMAVQVTASLDCDSTRLQQDSEWQALASSKDSLDCSLRAKTPQGSVGMCELRLCEEPMNCTLADQALVPRTLWIVSGSRGML